MDGAQFVANLKSNKNVFIHRMMECLGDRKMDKLVSSIYDDLSGGVGGGDTVSSLKAATVDNIATFDSAQLAEYVEHWQLHKVRAMMIEGNLNGLRFLEQRRCDFAAELKRRCGVPIGVGTMLFVEMKHFEFMEQIDAATESESERVEAISCPVEFASMIRIVLNVDDHAFCESLWTAVLQKDGRGELESMAQREMMRFIAGHRVNAVFGEVMATKTSKVSVDAAEGVIRRNVQWLDDDADIKQFGGDFMKWIGAHFESDLVLILLFNDDVAAMNYLSFLWELDRHDIGWRALTSNKDEVEQKVAEIQNGLKSFVLRHDLRSF